MYRNSTIGVVVPAYNEEAFVGGVVRDLPEFVDAVYLVDDASTDETWAAMGEAMEAREVGGTAVPAASAATERRVRSVADRISDSETIGNVTRLRHSENRGAGGAVKTGYLAALEDGVDVIATIDGDGQMDSGRLPRILDPVVTGQAEYAKGNRFAGRDLVREMPAFRLFGNVLLTGLTRVASGYWQLSDPQNGFTAVSRDALKQVDVDGIWEYYGYMNQLMAQLNAANVRVADVPMPVTYGDEESSIDYLQYIRRVSLLLLVSFVRRLSRKYSERNPSLVPVCYAVGATVGSVTVLGGLLSAATGDRKRISRRTTAGGLVISLAAFVVAAVLDRAAIPIAVDATKTRPGLESDGTGWER
ncbi:glycosyltransferase family 2 protein [Halostella sp. JP-L12]|uniref:glycosyltransferase family 2 protein n=1 Tax=Halostella TaxID=1843185 RepID=UPI000EF84CFB|nr:MULTISPECIES: glycosyltransferase family 2 protein [Halostella]NHN46665.1 glycosyltransferase family 2 protein [Halostella sp. JP-L12]